MKPEDITVIVDSREKTPWNLNPMKMEKGTLATGDYTILGLEDVVAVERKSLQDLVACVGRERERFEREMQRMLGYQRKFLIIEGTWDDVEMGKWRGKTHANAVYGSLVGWAEKGVHVCLMGDAHGCERYVNHLFYMIMRRFFDRHERLKKQCGLSVAP